MSRPPDLSTYFPDSTMPDSTPPSHSSKTITLHIKSQTLHTFLHLPPSSPRSPRTTALLTAQGFPTTATYELKIPLETTIENTRKRVWEREAIWGFRCGLLVGALEGARVRDGTQRGSEESAETESLITRAKRIADIVNQLKPEDLNLVWRSPSSPSSSSSSVVSTSTSASSSDGWHLLTSPSLSLFQTTWAQLLRSESLHAQDRSESEAEIFPPQRLIVTYPTNSNSSSSRSRSNTDQNRSASGYGVGIDRHADGYSSGSGTGSGSRSESGFVEQESAPIPGSGGGSGGESRKSEAKENGEGEDKIRPEQELEVEVINDPTYTSNTSGSSAGVQSSTPTTSDPPPPSESNSTTSDPYPLSHPTSITTPTPTASMVNQSQAKQGHRYPLRSSSTSTSATASSNSSSSSSPLVGITSSAPGMMSASASLSSSSSSPSLSTAKSTGFASHANGRARSRSRSPSGSLVGSSHGNRDGMEQGGEGEQGEEEGGVEMPSFANLARSSSGSGTGSGSVPVLDDGTLNGTGTGTTSGSGTGAGVVGEEEGCSTDVDERTSTERENGSTPTRPIARKTTNPVLLMPDGVPISTRGTANAFTSDGIAGFSGSSTNENTVGEDGVMARSRGATTPTRTSALAPSPSMILPRPTPTRTTAAVPGTSMAARRTPLRNLLERSRSRAEQISNDNQTPMTINPAHSTLVQLVHYHQYLLSHQLKSLLPVSSTPGSTPSSPSDEHAIEQEWKATGASVTWKEATRLVEEELIRLGISREVVLASLGLGVDDAVGLGGVGGRTSDGRRKGKGKERGSGMEGEFVAVVEVGGQVQELVIPDTLLLSDPQKAALEKYIETKQMVEYLQGLLCGVPFQIPVIPSAAQSGSMNGAAGGNPGELALFGGRMRIRTGLGANNPNANANVALLFTPQLLVPCFAALLKVQFTLYMFSHGLFSYSVKDKVFWMMMVASFGWWLWDCYKLWTAEILRRRREVEVREALQRVREERARREAAELAGENAAAAGENGLPGTNGANVDDIQTGIAEVRAALRDAAAAPQPAAAVPLALGQNFAAGFNDGFLRFADWGLEHDRRQLRLFHYPDSARPQSQPGVPPDLTVPDHLVPGSEVDLPIATAQPGLWWTAIVLPFHLFITSLVPVWDLRRRGMIRERERHMRTLVEKLTAGRRAERAKEIVDKAARAVADAGAIGEPGEASPGPQSEMAAIAPNDGVGDAAEQVLPGGLSRLATLYYQRVLARGEQIDWDEEREAQAALIGGAGPAGAGDRLDMF